MSSNYHPFPQNSLIFEGRVFDALFLYRFIKRLVTPFEETDAYKLGIIDKDGNNLIPSKDLKTTEEKNAYTHFDILIFNLKKLIEKLPFGKHKLASYAAAMFLLKEDVPENEDILADAFAEFLDAVELDAGLMATLQEFIAHENSAFRRYFHRRVIEDAPVNNVGGGGIAGTGHDGEDPAVPPKAAKKYKKKNKDDQEDINESLVDKFFKMQKELMTLRHKFDWTERSVAEFPYDEYGKALNDTVMQYAREFGADIKYLKLKPSHGQNTSAWYNIQSKIIQVDVPAPDWDGWRSREEHYAVVGSVMHEFIHSLQGLTVGKLADYKHASVGGTGLNGARYMLQSIEQGPFIIGTILRFYPSITPNRFSQYIKMLMDGGTTKYWGDDEVSPMTVWVTVDQIMKDFSFAKSDPVVQTVCMITDYAHHAIVVADDPGLRRRMRGWLQELDKNYKLFHAYAKTLQ